jgi:hypothetical protein
MLFAPDTVHFPIRLLTGYGFPWWSQNFLCWERYPVEGPLSRPPGILWPLGSISQREPVSADSPSRIGAFIEVVMFAGVVRDTGSVCGRALGWARLNANREDLVELELAADLQRSGLAHVAESLCITYTSQINLFVAWCGALAEPRLPLPASDGTAALYLQSVMNGAKMFAPLKAASAAIAFYQKINLFDHDSVVFNRCGCSLNCGTSRAGSRSSVYSKGSMGGWC